jgi:RNA polymerase-interacting CarD/CdnL/TRCF family regulator
VGATGVEAAVHAGTKEITMAFQVGDKVVHWSYGPGEIIQLDEKSISGQSIRYYVVRVRDLTLWVPVDADGQPRLRQPTSTGEFKKLFEILRGPAETLSDDRLERKAQLTGRLRDGTLFSICRVIRDLKSLSQRKKLNDYDAAVLERARKFLLDEWNISLSVSLIDAERQLDHLLDEGRASD